MSFELPALFKTLSMNSRLFSTTRCTNLIQKWRREKGLPLNPNAHGALTDNRDYTYLDGRPTPYGVRQKNRIMKHREIASKIIKLSAEMDFAVERHERLQKEAKTHREEVLKNKLVEKGDALLKKPE